MRRRVLLAATSTVLSGCFGGVLDEPFPSFVVEDDSVPDGLPATFSTELLARPTADHPARLRVSFVNTDDRPREFVTGYPFPFADRVGGERNGAKLVLEYEPTANERGDCWRTDSPYVGPGTDGGRVNPGERHEVEWSVLSHVDNEACFPSREYRFETDYEVGGATYRWGFTV